MCCIISVQWESMLGYLVSSVIVIVLVPLLLSLSGRLHFERGQFTCHDPSIQLQYRKALAPQKVKQKNRNKRLRWSLNFLPSQGGLCPKIRTVFHSDPAAQQGHWGRYRIGTQTFASAEVWCTFKNHLISKLANFFSSWRSDFKHPLQYICLWLVLIGSLLVE